MDESGGTVSLTEPDQTRVFERLKSVADVLVPAVAVMYALGFLVTNLWAGTFGLATFDLLRARYVLSGVLFLSFLVVAFVLAYDITHGSRDLFQKWAEITLVILIASYVVQLVFEHEVRDAAGVAFLSLWLDSYVHSSHVLLPISLLLGYNVVFVRERTTGPSIASRELPRWSRESLSQALALTLSLIIFSVSIDAFGGIYSYVLQPQYRAMSFQDPPMITWSSYFGVLVAFGACLTGVTWSVRRLYARRAELSERDRRRLIDAGKEEMWAKHESDSAQAGSVTTLWLRERSNRAGVVVAFALLVPLYTFGVYPLLPVEVGGGRFERVRIETTDPALRSLVTQSHPKVYLLDVTSDATLLVLVTPRHAGTITVRAQNKEIEAIVGQNR